MTYHYHVDCDGCGKGVDDWDGIPAGWITVNTLPSEKAAHFCEDCWLVMRNSIRSRKGEERKGK